MAKHHPKLVTAIALLEELGSDEDTIYYKDEATTPNDLFGLLTQECTTNGWPEQSKIDSLGTEDILIDFGTSNGGFVCGGTFADMIKDRQA